MWKKKWRKSTRGSMVIEATLVIPFFIFILILFLAWMRTYTVTILLRQRMEALSIEISTYYYGGELIGDHLTENEDIKDFVSDGLIWGETPFLKEKILGGTSLKKENFILTIQVEDEVLIMKGIYYLDFLLGYRVTIDESTYRKVLVP